MPRVVLLTHDSLYSRVFLDAFTKAGGGQVIGAVCSTATLHRGQRTPLDILAFTMRVGMIYALYQLWAARIRPAFSRLPSIAAYCRQRRLPCLATSDINGTEATAFIAALEPDFVLCFHFNQRLLEPALRLAQIATVNVHPSALPDLAGVDPVWFHLATGSGRLGVTVHRVTAEIDRGDIYAQEIIATRGGGLVTLNRDLFATGGRMAARVLQEFAAFDGKRTAQPGGAGSYYGWRDIRRFGTLRPLLRRAGAVSRAPLAE